MAPSSSYSVMVQMRIPIWLASAARRHVCTNVHPNNNNNRAKKRGKKYIAIRLCERTLVREDRRCRAHMSLANANDVHNKF
jgi:hypothetical protein